MLHLSTATENDLRFGINVTYEKFIQDFSERKRWKIRNSLESERESKRNSKNQVEKSQYCPFNTSSRPSRKPPKTIFCVSVCICSFFSVSADRDDYWTIKVIKLPVAKKKPPNATKAFCRFLAKDPFWNGAKDKHETGLRAQTKCDRWFCGCFKFGTKTPVKIKEGTSKLP